MKKLFNIKNWPVGVIMTVVPVTIIGIYGAIILADVYFRTDRAEGSMEFSRCIFEYNCTHSELGLYALMGGMLFALSWAIAYAIHSKFPKNLSLLFLGTVIAAPFYAFGIGNVGELVQTDGTNREELSILAMSLMGSFGAAFHIFGAAIMIRLLNAFMKFRSKRNAESK